MSKDSFTKKLPSLLPRNCGVTLRSKQESLDVLREQLEQLKLQGKGESHLAKVYLAILRRT